MSAPADRVGEVETALAGRARRTTADPLLRLDGDRPVLGDWRD
ncbi:MULTISPECIES: hypothetical protein [Actinomadura]|uniref:Uncharacterized protein n=1 Tax=Actinomadura yumaensis TaxID=111807 RepID=A0ABW2CCT6_9ACTN|nr:hypothetical protein [Actinomadura sp. J1-007]